MKLEKLFEYEIIQTEDIEMKRTAGGDLLISPTSGGRFWSSPDEDLECSPDEDPECSPGKNTAECLNGRCLRGELLPAGFGTTRTRGTQNDIHSETILRTDDGCEILMTMDAIFDVAPEIEAQLIAGEPVDPESYYYKGTVSFETGAPQYKWLERKVCVTECRVEDYTKLHLTVYMVN